MEETPSTSASPNRTVMLVLSYLGILALVPLLVEKEDSEVQWHAKHGLIMLGSWIVLFVALGMLCFLPGIGWILSCGFFPCSRSLFSQSISWQLSRQSRVSA